jgi:hypothetical protein
MQFDSVQPAILLETLGWGILFEAPELENRFEASKLENRFEASELEIQFEASELEIRFEASLLEILLALTKEHEMMLGLAKPEIRSLTAHTRTEDK